MRRDDWEVYSKALAVSLAVYFLNWVAEKQLERVIHDRVFCWASAFAAVQMGIILCLSFSLVAFRTFARLKENLYEQMRPAIRDRVLSLAFEGESWSSTVPTKGPGREVLENSIANTLSTVKAAGRDRVARFATEHGFAAEWDKELSSGSQADRKRAVSLLGMISTVRGNAVLLKALHDKHAGVRAEAYRALLVAGEPAYVERVFCCVLQESLLMRALLADDLKRHAAYLLRHTIPNALTKASATEAAHIFEILVGWKRAIPSFDIQPWLSPERDPLLLRGVLALLPYVLTDDSIEEYVASALNSADLNVRCAAAEAAGRLKLARLLPALEAALAQNRRLAIAAAAAMAQLGEAGERSLEKIVAGSDRGAAAVAMEALEHATVRSR